MVDRTRPSYVPKKLGRPPKAPETTRICNTCNQEKPIDDFPFAGSVLFRRRQCRPCYNEIQRVKMAARYHKNPKLLAARQGLYRERKKRGEHRMRQTPEEYRADKYRRHLLAKAKVRIAVFAAYGGATCACCGETNEKFLSLDHIAGGGNEHGREIGIRGGWSFYRWLQKQGFPPGYQVLCFNCNLGRQHNKGTCPHKD